MSSNADIFKRVLFLGPDLAAKGGIASVLASYKRYLPSFNYLPTNSRRGTLAGALVLLSTLAAIPWHRLVRREKIAHVHACSGKSFIRKRMVIAWARLWGFKIVFHCHGGGIKSTFDRVGHSKVKRFLDRCSAVVVLSEVWRRYFETEFRHPRIEVVNNIIAPVGAAPKSALEGRPMTFLFLGKICKEKGIFDLLDVIADNRERLRGRFTLRVGADDPQGLLAEAIASRGVEDMVVPLGWVDGQRKDRELAEADVVVLPSYIEGLPITLLEAMDARCGIISTPVGGIPEIITHNVNGFLHVPGDKTALGRAITAYLDGPSLIRRHADLSRGRVADFYPGKVTSQLQELYTAILQG